MKAYWKSNDPFEEFGPLHEQDWAVERMKRFHDDLERWALRQCQCCQEWDFYEHPLVNRRCTRCNRQSSDFRHLFTRENRMQPDPIPPELKGLTEIEKMLIARACPVMKVYTKKGGMYQVLNCFM